MKELDKNIVEELVKLFKLKEYSQLENKIHELINIYPKNIFLRNILGLSYANQDKLDKAEKIFLDILLINSKHEESCNNLGLVYQKQNKLEDAIKYYNLAIENNPNFVEAIFNLGNAFRENRNLKDCIDMYLRAIEINPVYLKSYINLGNVYEEKNDYDLALKTYYSGLEKIPNCSDLFFCLGNIFQKQKKYEESIREYNNAIKNNPRNFQGYFALGNVYVKIGNLDKALGFYTTAISYNPKYEDSYINLALVLQELGKFDESLLNLNKSFSINKKKPEILNYIGNVFLKLRKYDEAILSYKKAILLNENYADAYNHLAIAYLEKDNFNEAINNSLIAFKLEPSLGSALSRYWHVKRICCDWSDDTDLYEDISTHISNVEVSESSKMIEPLNTFPLFSFVDDPFIHSKATKQFSKYKKLNRKIKKLYYTNFNKNNFKFLYKIKIAYISGDYQNHPVFNTIQDLFALHDRKQFEVHAISLGSKINDQNFKNKLLKSFDFFHEVGEKSDQEIANLIYKLNINIAVDLMGYTKKGRPNILAQRPAPIQISYLGYLGTMGNDYIDYIIADQHVILKDVEKSYSEKIIYLPNCYQINSNILIDTENKYSKTNYHLPEDSFVFGCFNSNYKISQEIYSAWLSILKETNNSVLWLYESNKISKKNLLNEALKEKILEDRIVFAKKLPLSEHLARISFIDLFLDTYPYNAGATCSFAFLSNVPVLTLEGKSFTSRMAASQLLTLGLPSLIVNSVENYIKKAISLCENKNEIVQLKKQIKECRSKNPLFNTNLFTKNIELAYISVWENYCKGYQAKNFIIKDS